jgi:hypothetical protein
MKTPALLLAAAAALLSLAADAQERFLPDDIRATIGVRAWRSDWTSWFDPAHGSYIGAEGATVVTPVASLRYHDFLLSGSYTIEKDFTFRGFNPGEPSLAAPRKEYDVNVGYFILPSVAAVIGYKQIEYNVGAYTWEAKGPTIGLSGSAPLVPWSSLYGNIAYGRLKMTDNDAFSGTRGKYLLTEFGLAFPLGHWDPSMSAFVLTAGYRYQKLGSYPNRNNYPNRELFEYTQGPVVGISFSL